MRKFILLTSAAALTLTLVTSTQVNAQSMNASQPHVLAQSETGFELFSPKTATRSTRIDYTVWDDALKNVVLDLGPSLRRRASRPEASIGTRIINGHKTAYRLEGSRITFGYMTDAYRRGLTEYRMDLQDLPSRIDITALPRNEQLAFWLNLHNVGMIEQIADVYPSEHPSTEKIKIDGVKFSIDTAKFLTVNGQNLSLKDIRTKVVFPNWDDPRVIYGFFRGNIGSPKMARSAFAASNLEYLLNDNSNEFVNSLRGFHEGYKYRKISDIYEEAAPFYFPSFDTDLTAHLLKFAERDTIGEVKSGKPFDFDKYDTMVADLSGGRRTAFGAHVSGSTKISAETMRLLSEVETKRRILIEKGLTRPRGGYVIIEDIVLSGEPQVQTPVAPDLTPETE